MSYNQGYLATIKNINTINTTVDYKNKFLW